MTTKTLKIVIVSTYPKEGSKNIGDQLITNSLISAIKDINPNASFDIVFRADKWSSVKDKILKADHVFFACLAIRRFMDKNEYPWMSKVLDSKVPFSCIASGTDLLVNKSTNIYSDISSSASSLLSRINKQAVTFTTRGQMSQFFCESLGLDQCIFNGDIAFYNTKYAEQKFISHQDIRNIIISDPHRPKAYINSLDVLINGLKNIFPDANITIAQHGINPTIQNYCDKHNIKTVKIYEKPDTGLDIYDNADLHVGYRVHAHVSALSRRKYSYLLEQDGRGCDYGLTLEKKISIPSYINVPAVLKPNKVLEKLYFKATKQPITSVSPAHQMLALIQGDKALGFEKFLNLEKQIEGFNKSTLLSLQKSLN